MMAKEVASVERNDSNYYAGWVLALGKLTAGVALNPLAVYHNPSVETGEVDSFFLIATAVMALVSIGAYTLFTRPYVTVRDGVLVVQNPLRQWRLPLPEIDVVEDSYPYASVRCRGHRVWMLAAEQSNYMFFVGDTRLVDHLNVKRRSPSTCRIHCLHSDCLSGRDRTGYNWCCSLFGAAMLSLLVSVPLEFHPARLETFSAADHGGGLMCVSGTTYTRASATTFRLLGAS